MRNNDTCDTVEEVVPLHDLQPEGSALDYASAAGYLPRTLPILNGYQIIEISHA